VFLFIVGLILVVVGLAASSGRRDEIRGDDGKVIRSFSYDRAGRRIMSPLLLVAGVFMIVMSFLVIVPSGHVAVITILGRVQPEAIPEGLHTKLPWADTHIMSVRRQTERIAMNASTMTGVTVDLEMSLVFRLNPAQAAEVFQTVGMDYFDVLIAPFINRTTKDIFVIYNPEDLYTMDRASVNVQIEDSLRARLGPLGIILEQAPIENIDLPQTLRDAIVAKQEAEQEALRMEYVIQAQELESDRMRIEAQGIADYQEIVSAGISEQFLAWKAIEVTEALAASENTTFVIIGDTENGLPMIYQSR
jgi:regulator of protease activity HflC (stomatin/prohibitin superfamily)